MNIIKKIGCICTACALLLTLAAGCGTAAGSSTSAESLSSGTDSSLVLSSEVNPEELSFSDKDLDGTWDDGSATHITLSDSAISVNGDGAEADGSVLTITKAGTYVLTGSLSDGQIIVNASKDDKVQIVLNGASVTCSDSAAVYVEQADKVFLTAAENTQNTLACGDTFSSDAQADEITGAVFSRDDLTVNGTGILTVTGNYKHGIVSKDDLVLADVSLSVTAVSDGLRGKDCVKIASGTYTITAGKDGIQSSNDSDASLGFVYLAGGTFTISAGNDGVQAETLLCVTGGSADITTGGGSANAVSKTSGFAGGDRGQGGMQIPGSGGAQTTSAVDAASETTDSSAAASTTETESDSAKGLKAGVALVLSGGSFTIDSADDSVHCNGDVAVRDGCTLNASTGDDGIHADNALTISGGEITISKSYEGLEGLQLTVSGGTIHVTSSDDGLNAAGGSDSSSASQAGKDTASSGETPEMTISGGTLYVNAGGDGLDSNGTLSVTGGEVYVDGPTNAGNGALDYGDGSEATISGGTVVAAGAAGMAVGFGEDSTQCSMLVIFDSTISGGTELTVTDSSGKVILSYTPSKEYQTAVISSASLTEGATYTVAAGDVSTEVTLSGVSTTSGTQTGNMGGGKMNSGGAPQDGTRSGPPSGGHQNGGTPPDGTTGTTQMAPGSSTDSTT